MRANFASQRHVFDRRRHNTAVNVIRLSNQSPLAIVLVSSRSKNARGGFAAHPANGTVFFQSLVAADYWRLSSGPWPSGKLLVFNT